MASPVLGFLPVLALRWETEKVPNPEMLTFSPFFKAAMMSSKRLLTISSAFSLGISVLFATESTKSAFVMTLVHPTELTRRAKILYNHRPAPVSIIRTPFYRVPDSLRQDTCPGTLFLFFTIGGVILAGLARFRLFLQKALWIR